MSCVWMLQRGHSGDGCVLDINRETHNIQGYNITLDDALANASTIFWISSAEWAISALSSAKNSYLTSIFVVFVFALKWCRHYNITLNNIYNTYNNPQHY